MSLRILLSAALCAIAAADSARVAGSTHHASANAQAVRDNTSALSAVVRSAGAAILNYLHSRNEALHITSASPVKCTYIDWRDVNWSKPQQNILDIADAGYNVIILSFYLSKTGPADMAEAWASVDPATQNATIAYAHSKGAVVLVSAGGSTDIPYGMDGGAFGRAVANYSLANHLDGVDFDLENIGPGFVVPGMTDTQLVDWMLAATSAARGLLGSAAIITHAPQAPYFGPTGGAGGGNSWPGPTGGYTAVWKGAAGAITFFNLQFYNQGATCYTSYASLFNQSNAGGACTDFPYTSVAEIASYGVPLAAQVVGKPLEVNDAGSGWVSAANLSAWFAQAGEQLGWSAGVMAWSWDPADSANWIHTIYPSASV